MPVVVRHAHVATPEPDENPAKQIGRARWNEAHTVTGAVASADVPGLEDIGQWDGVTPYVLVDDGQSNAIGASNEGDKTIASNIFITNSISAPTSIIPAAYGTAPLDLTEGGGHTTNPSLAYNCPAISFANALRASSLIPDERPIVIILTGSGGKSISNWIDPVGTDAWTTVDLWAQLEAHHDVVQAAYPTATINHVMWMQGENDSGLSTSYGSRDLYLAGFDRLVTKYQALPMWSPRTRMSVSELGTWANNTNGQTRNDAIRALQGKYPFLSVVSSTGLAETAITANLGPHFNSASLKKLGERHFYAWVKGRIAGKDSSFATYYGSAMAFPNLINASASGQTIHPDDIRTGALILANGNTITLPNAAQADYFPVIINAVSTTTLTVSGTLLAANRGSFTSSGFSLGAGSRWRLQKVSSTAWWIEQINHNVVGAGNFSRYTSSSRITGTSTLTGSTQVTGCAYTLSGATLTITSSFGMDVLLFGGASSSTVSLSSGSFTLPDGTTTSTLTLQTDDVVWIVGRITGTSSLATDVVYWRSLQSRSAQRSAPTTGQTITSNPNIGHLTHVIEPAGTIAALTITLPSNPKNGNSVTYVAVQQVTAVTFSGGTVVAAPAGLAAGTKLTLTYESSQAKWY